MQGVIDAIQYFLDFGPAVFLPVIMLVIGLILRMRFGRAFSAALTLGVGFAGMSVLIGFMMGVISPAAKAMVERTGFELTALDVGWPAAAAITWAWPYAPLVFPVQIAINLALLGLGWTEILIVDMWNVWHKVTIAAYVTWLTGSLPLALVIAGIWVVMELKVADLIKERTYALTRIPGVVASHPNMIDFLWESPIMAVLERIPGLGELQLDPERLREKIGIFGENHVLGFIIGGLIAVLAGYGIQDITVTAVKSAAALMILPMVAALFMRAFAPFADAANEFMRERFPGRDVFIGVDWPILGGQASLWVAAIINVPLLLILSVILPGNIVLPFGAIVMLHAAMSAVIIARGDVVKTTIMTFFNGIISLYGATYFTTFYTELAKNVGFEFPEGATLISWIGTNGQAIRIVLFEAAEMFLGRFWPGIIMIPLLAALWWFFVKHAKRAEEKARAESGGIPRASLEQQG